MATDVVKVKSTYLLNKERRKHEPIFVTEYDPKYCRLLLDYAYNKYNVDGFFSRYHILPRTSDKWAQEHQEWADALSMANFKVKEGLNDAINTLARYASGDQRLIQKVIDFNTMKQLIFKVYDTTFREDDKTGELKRKGIERSKKNRAVAAEHTIDQTAMEIAKSMQNMGNNDKKDDLEAKNNEE